MSTITPVCITSSVGMQDWNREEPMERPTAPLWWSNDSFAHSSGWKTSILHNLCEHRLDKQHVRLNYCYSLFQSAPQSAWPLKLKEKNTDQVWVNYGPGAKSSTFSFKIWPSELKEMILIVSKPWDSCMSSIFLCLNGQKIQCGYQAMYCVVNLFVLF